MNNSSTILFSARPRDLQLLRYLEPPLQPFRMVNSSCLHYDGFVLDCACLTAQVMLVTGRLGMPQVMMQRKVLLRLAHEPAGLY